MAEKVKGVDGWLLIFIVFLVFIVPLYLILVWLVSGFAGFSSASYTAHLRDFFELGMTLWGVFIGVSLWQKRSKAVIWAKEFLIAMFVLNTFFFINWLFIDELFTQWVGIFLFVNTYIFSYVLVGTVFSIAGLAYLTNSVRVKNTYKYRELNRNRVLLIMIGVIILTFVLVNILIPIYSPFSR